MTAGATVGLVMVAIVAALYARSQIKEAARARQQARDLADEIAQPYVVAFMEPSRASNTLFDLVVRNFGQTGAQDVKITASPPLIASQELGRNSEVYLPKSIPFLAPGQEWRTFWDSFASRKDSDLRDRYRVDVTFLDSRNKSLSTATELDWGVYRGRAWIDVKSVHDVARSLKEIEKTLRKPKP